MKKFTFLMLSISVIFYTLSFGQDIPNGSFEDWSNTGWGYHPDGWNAPFNDNNFSNVFPCDDAQSGSKSVELRAVYHPDFQNWVRPSVYLDPVMLVSEKPASLKGYFKGTSAGGDSLIITVGVWSTSGPIGIGMFSTNQTASSWTEFTVPVSYISILPPETVEISLVAGQQWSSNEGTSYLVDNLTLDFGSGPEAPVVLWAATDNTGAKVDVAFNKAMSDPAGTQSQFTVTTPANIPVSSVILKAGNPNIIELNLSSNIQQEQEVMLSYTAGSIAAVDGGVLVSFTGLPVTNNVGGSGTGAWYQVPGGTSLNLKDVMFADINTGWAVGEAGTILKSANGGATWAGQNTVALFDLRSLWVTSATKAMCTSWDSVYMTQNGGTTWSPVWTQSINVNINDIFFLDANNGYIAGEWSYVAKTADGGNSWSGGHLEWGDDLNSICFTDANSGTAVGSNNLIIHTTNGGTSWSQIEMGSWSNLQSVFFTNATTGYTVGGFMAFKTTDGGQSWNEIFIEGIGEADQLNCIYFLNQNTGWICGSYGLILKTADAGETWTQYPAITNEDLNAIYFVNENLGWAVGNFGTILKYGQSSGIFNKKLPAYDLTVYPNPAKNVITISFFTDNKTEINTEIIDMMGNVVISGGYEIFQPGHCKIEANVQSLLPGLYTCRLIDNKGNNDSRMMVIHP